MLGRLTDADGVPAGLHPAFLRACARQDLLAQPSPDSTASAIVHDLIAGLVDRQGRRSLGFNVEQTVRVAGAVRDRLSTDNWRVLNRLLQLFTRDSRALDLDDALELIDDALVSLVAVGGLEMAHMTRDDGWRFLSLGRHLERLHFVSSTLGDVAPEQASAGSGLLEWLLELSDSLLTYRVRHMQHPEWESVVDLMLVDERNPRSARFQLAKLAKHVRLLPDAGLIDVLAEVEQLLHDCRSDVDAEQGELFGGGERRLEALLTGCQQRLHAPRLRALAPLLQPRRRRAARDGRRMTAALYRIEHETRYVHSGGVSTSQHVAYLTPRTLPRQRVRWHELVIEPAPASRVQRIDYFGNAVDQFTILTPYDEMRVVGRSVVEVTATEPPIDARRRRAVGSGPRRALLPARRAVRRRRGVQLSVAVRRHGPGAGRVRARVVRPAPAAGRGGGRPDAPDPRRVHLRSRSDDDRDAGDARARRSPRRLPGLRAPADRLPAVARARRALRQRLSADRSAAGTAAARRRRRVSRLALRLVSAARLGRSRSHQRRPAVPAPRDARLGTRLRRRQPAARRRARRPRRTRSTSASA